MGAYDDYLRSKDHAEMVEVEMALYERNRVEISMGLLLLCLWIFQIGKIVVDIGFWCLIAYTVLRRIPPLKPALLHVWRVWLMPLAKLDDWFMARWWDFKVWLGKQRMEMAHDFELLKAWAAVAVKREKTEIDAAAMAQHHYGLVGRVLSPFNVLGMLPVIVAVVSLAFSGVVLWWNGGLRDKLREARGDTREAIEALQGATTRLEQAEADYAKLKAQRESEMQQAAAEALESQKLRAGERRRRALLTQAERRIRDEAAKAAAGGPPVDWDRELRDNADPQPDAPVSAPSGSAAPGNPAG